MSACLDSVVPVCHNIYAFLIVRVRKRRGWRFSAVLLQSQCDKQRSFLVSLMGGPNNKTQTSHLHPNLGLITHNPFRLDFSCKGSWGKVRNDIFCRWPLQKRCHLNASSTCLYNAIRRSIKQRLCDVFGIVSLTTCVVFSLGSCLALHYCIIALHYCIALLYYLLTVIHHTYICAYFIL